MFKSIKKAYYKFKYLDKTQFKYFIVTGFIGAFCLFTTATYSAFNVFDSLNAVTITIAKLNYTLTSDNSNFTNNKITVPSKSTIMLDLTLTSLNDFRTKYALNYTSTSSSVYYSENLKNNMLGEIGTRNSSINMRVVLVNNSNTSDTVTLKISGGYLHNNLTSNINTGYFEEDFVVRTLVYNENLDSIDLASSFPTNNGTYAYFNTSCTSPVDAQWSNSEWKLNINNITVRSACDIYFKKLKNNNDTELIYVLSGDENGTSVTYTKPSTDYDFDRVTCNNGAVATWNSTTREVTITNNQSKNLCVAYFNYKN